MTSKRRPRFVREGSVGLLAIAGMMVLAAAGLWLRGHSFGQRSYKVLVEFFSVSGLQVGSPVRFRGIKIGRVTNIRPGPDSAEVELTISPPSTVIPRAVFVEANQSGLISETSIDFTPMQQTIAASSALKGNPADPQCDRTVMICDGDRLKGNIGVSFDQLIRTSVRFAEVYGDPTFLKNLNQALNNASRAAANLATLSTEMTSTARSLKTDVTRTADTLETNLTGLQANVSGLAQDIRGQVPALSASVRSVGQAADRISSTTGELGTLLHQNRAQIETTLRNFSDASAEFKVALGRVSPLLQRVEQGKMLENLETFSSNAAKASVSLRELVSTASNPGTLVVLYQLLDSARATFQNTQKLTSDLDEITGDPTFRRNLRDLVKGLNKLISSAETLEQQTQVARLLSSAEATSAENIATSQLSRAFPPKVAHFIAPLQITPSAGVPTTATASSSRPGHGNESSQPAQPTLPPNLNLAPPIADASQWKQNSWRQNQWGQLSTLISLLKAFPFTHPTNLMPLPTPSPSGVPVAPAGVEPVPTVRSPNL